MLLACLTAAMMMTACQESIDTTARYVFSEKTIAQYLTSHEEYSEYVRLLGRVRVSSISETTLLQLLSARGHYTVFAPTDQAIRTYLDSLVAMHYFDDYVLYGYAVKLKLLERRDVFEKDKGSAEFERLFSDVQQKIMSI